MILSRFFLLTALLYSSLCLAQTPQLVLDEMLSACDRVQTLRFNIGKRERMDGSRFIEGTSAVKYRKVPFSVYFKSVEPDNGVEVLFIKGWNDNKAFINPGGFPYVNVSLSPFAERMRATGHFTVYDLGFETLVRNLRHTLSKNNGKVTAEYTLDGTVNFDGRVCYKLILEHNDYKWVKYTVPKPILLTSLAMERALDAYAIKERNKLGSFGQIAAGTVLQMPTSFVKKLILYIDKSTYLPVVQEMHDDKGFFARYEFTKLVVNPVLAPDDLTTKHKDYHF